MSVGYELVNYSRKELISFCHLPVNTIREIYSHPVSAMIVTWYMANNIGDEIQFVSDTHNDWPFSGGKKPDLFSFVDKTEEVLTALLESQHLIDCGFLFQDEDEPETVFIRDIRLAGESKVLGK